MRSKLLLSLILLLACAPGWSATPAVSPYLDYAGRDDILTGGVKMVEITTPKGKFHVWTKRVGNNPRVKVLILHGGPSFGHEAYEAFDSYFPGAGIEYYYYDQLDSSYSDQPSDPDLWNVARFVDEVEQVRQALHLDKSNFYLYGHSWGGILAMEYALKYQQNLKGLIISNMMSSIPAYNEYAKKVLIPQIDPVVYKQIKGFEDAKDYDNPKYDDLMMANFYVYHFLRLPPEQWPEPVLRAINHMNKKIYVAMQGPSELGASGVLEHWDRSRDLGRIAVPTLVIGAAHDTMDPKHMEWMSHQVQHGRFLFCPNGSHMSIYDDQKTYMTGLIGFIQDVDAARF